MNDEEPKSPEEALSEENLEFIHLFEQMADLLQFTLENSEKSIKVPLPKVLEDQLVQLERNVDTFCKLNNAVITDYKKPAIDPRLNMTKRELEVYDRSKSLVVQAEEKIAVIKNFLRTASAKGQIETTPEEKKKHFKRYGQREKWKKM